MAKTKDSRELSIYASAIGTEKIAGRNIAIIDYTIFNSAGEVVENFRAHSGGFGNGALPGLHKDYDRGQDTHHFAGMDVNVNALYKFDGDGANKDKLGVSGVQRGYSYESSVGFNLRYDGWSQSYSTPVYIRKATGRDGFAAHPDGRNGGSDRVDDGTMGCIGFAHQTGDAKRYLNWWNKLSPEERPTEISIVSPEVKNQLLTRSRALIAQREAPLSEEKLNDLANAVFNSGDAYSRDVKNFQERVGVSADGVSGSITKYAYNLSVKNGGITPEVIKQAQAYEALPKAVRDIDFAGLANIKPSEHAPVARNGETEINSPFAARRLHDLEAKGVPYSKNHYKADYEGQPGDKVLAPYGGVIVDVQSTYMVYKTDNGLIVTDTHVRPLSGDSKLEIGDRFEAGDKIAQLGNKSNNGGYAPHLDRSYQLGSTGMYLNPNKIHPDFHYDKEQATELANRDANIFYDRNNSQWIKQETLAKAGINLDSIANLSQNQVLLASVSGKALENQAPQQPLEPTPLEQAIAATYAPKKGTGEMLLTSNEPQMDIASATGFVATEHAPKAAPIDEAMLAAQGVGEKVKQFVSSSLDIDGNAWLKGLQHWAETIKDEPKTTTEIAESTQKFSPLEEKFNEPFPAIAKDNPFNIERALVKAEIEPAQPQAEAKPEIAQAPQPDAKEKIAEMFARFNPEHGKTVIVKQTYDELSAQEREAAAFVQKIYNKLGYLEITDSEYGHVAGGKTERATKEFQRDSKDLRVDGVVGTNTYAKLEDVVHEKVANNPELSKALVTLADEYKAQDVERARALADNIQADPNAAKTPAELAANPNLEANRGVGV